MSKSKKITSKKLKITRKKQKNLSEKDLLKLLKQRKEKTAKFKYNVRKDSTMKKYRKKYYNEANIKMNSVFLD